jgi:hypothetical protein
MLIGHQAKNVLHISGGVKNTDNLQGLRFVPVRMPLTIQDLKLEILKLFAEGQKKHKFNLLGRPVQRGELEMFLGLTFDRDQRALAAQAFEQLKGGGLIRSTLSDLVDPENRSANASAHSRPVPE